MIPEDIKEKIRKFKKLRVLNTDKTTYKFNTRNKTLYIPISETDFKDMFCECFNLREIELAIDNIIEAAAGMFCECVNLEEIIFTKKLNLIKVETLHLMFCECESLKYIDFRNIITSSNLKSTVDLFYHCYNLRKVDFGDNFHSENIEDASDMFHTCKSLEIINWKSNQPFNNLRYMQEAFNTCNKLAQLDLRGVDFSNILELDNIFNDTNPDLKVFVNDTFRENMF